MSDESPELNQPDVQEAARTWLYRLESLVRVRNHVEADKLFHKNCVYFGLEDNRMKVDWEESWKSQRKFSVDMNQVKIIAAGDLIMAAAPWVAESHIIGGGFKQGRLTVGLMNFSSGKLLCVHYHSSYLPG